MLAPDFYLAYLNSPAWRSRRSRALQIAGYRCHRCPSKRDLQVHHKSYERLGAEHDDDLEVVCATCHEREHISQAEGHSDGIYFRLAREAVRAEPFASLADLSEAVKCSSARHKIPYDSGRITRALTTQEAHEILCRLDLSTAIKAMPLAGRTAAEQEAHEARIREQIAALAPPRPKRIPLRERLEAIFAKVER